MEGVQAVERVARQLGSADWEQPACGHWSGTETARHLLAVARWYHAWLDRALAGDKAQPFPARDMDEQNRQALVDLSDLEAVNAIAGFAESAEAYVDRALNHWDLPFGYPYGLVVRRGFDLVEGGSSAADFCDDLFGGLVPDEGLGVVVPVFGPDLDGIDEVGHAGEHASA